MQYDYKGLSLKEVEESRNKFGNNEIFVKKKETLFIKVLHIFLEPMFLLLVIAATIYFILGEITDGIIMLVFVLFISGIEFFQEQKTSKAIEQLNTLSSLNVKVIRDGKQIVISSKDVVVGDIVILEEGDKIPADSIVLEAFSLGVNESNLTGESITIYKNIEKDDKNYFKSNICYASTNVVNGNGLVRVIAVGLNTEYGKIGKSLGEIKNVKTPLEKEINKLVFVCTIISLIFFLLVVILNFINLEALSLKDRIIDSILSGITVAMATIPEEIPVVLSVFLAMGAWHLAKNNALVKNMKATETLGAVSVLCTDKTGTLTQNKMSVVDKYNTDELFYEALFLACPIKSYDAVDIAIQTYCKKKKIKIEDNSKLIYEYPFNDKTKMIGQIWQIGNKKILYVKGAYENILKLCELSKIDNDKVLDEISKFSKESYRILASAYVEIDDIKKTIDEYKLNFLGLVALNDLPRSGVDKSIQICKDAKVRVVMITGDSPETASSIAKRIGIDNYNEVISGEQIEKLSDKDMQEVVKNTNIFARVYPHHKMKIVNAMQTNGEVVAMTGDGVNDALALKKAEIGIAMGKRGTNVAKEAADMILIDDNFNTIVNAIKNGRVIYQNIQKAISYILAIHMPIALSSIFIPIFKLPTLLIPIHVVLLELIIDPTSSIIFQRLKQDVNVMKEKPRKINKSIISKKIVFTNIMQGFFMFLIFFGSYMYLIKNNMSIEFATTFSFTTLVFSNIFLVYVLQSKKIAIKNFIDDLSDKVIVGINLAIVIILLLLIYVPFLNNLVGFCPISFTDLILCILLAMLATLPFDILKIFKNI